MHYLIYTRRQRIHVFESAVKLLCSLFPFPSGREAPLLSQCHLKIGGPLGDMNKAAVKQHFFVHNRKSSVT